jgi:hypothetical protein
MLSIPVLGWRLRMIKKDERAVLKDIMIVIVMITIGLLSGCTSPTDNTQSNAMVSYPVLSITDGSILEAAYNDYQTFKQTISFKEARIQLLDTLNNHTEGVDTAELGVDGYTIFVTYTDGDYAAVDTFEYTEEPSDNTEFSVLEPSWFSPAYPSHEPEGIRFDSYPPEIGSSSANGYMRKNTPTEYNIIVVGSQEKTTCESKKVLVLGPCYWQFPKEPTDDCIALFKQYGWPEEDITVKLVTMSPYQNNTDCLKLVPDDYFKLDDYGIILFPGHGAISAKDNFEETNVYMQFCFFNNASFVNTPILKEWQKDKKLLVFDRYRTKIDGVPQFVYMTGIRTDLLRQKITGTLPSSYLCFATCYGEYLGKVFLDKGGKVFLSWNKSVRAVYADGNMRNMLQVMLENESSVYTAYENPAIVKAYSEHDPWHPMRGMQSPVIDEDLPEPPLVYDVQFHILPDPQKDSIARLFYLPTWMNLELTGIPAGTSYIRVSVYDSRKMLLVTGEQSVGAAQSTLEMKYVGNSCFPPTEELTIEVQAFDGFGEELSSRQTMMTLNAGENTISITFGIDVWTLSGSAEDPKAPIDSVEEVVRLNGESVFEFEGYYPSFRANPGDSLRIFYMTTLYYGSCNHMGPIWLHCISNGYKKQITDYQDFGCYYEETIQVGVFLYDQTFLIPNPQVL